MFLIQLKYKFYACKEFRFFSFKIYAEFYQLIVDITKAGNIDIIVFVKLKIYHILLFAFSYFICLTDEDHSTTTVFDVQELNNLELFHQYTLHKE